MHCHPLSLSMQKAAAARTSQAARICDVCRDSIEGLFYRCKECKLDVHSLCTQLPEKLNHALHNIHPLTLQTSPTAGFCAVCRRSCGGWRYRCGSCSFDIHPECVLEPVVKCPSNGQTDRGIPFQPPPFYGYPYGPGYPNFGPGVNMYHGGPYMYTPSPGYPNFGPGFNMYYGGPYMYPPGNFQNFQAGASNGSNLLGKSMFSLVARLGFGVVSSMIFGVDLSSVFGGLG